jgi:hypothetical protein
MNVFSLLLFYSSGLYLLFSYYILQLYYILNCVSTQICLIQAANVFLYQMNAGQHKRQYHIKEQH